MTGTSGTVKLKPINTDTEETLESVRINGVSVLSGLSVERM